jgi:hypothetical protein
MADFLALARSRVVVDLGQLDGPALLALRRAVKAGEIARWRGHWHPVPGASFGIGPLKTCYGPLEHAPHPVQDLSPEALRQRLYARHGRAAP